MPVFTGIKCRHHEQDTEVFCGEAAEMMIAANQKPALLGPGFTQNGLASLRTVKSPKDFTTPADVRDVLQRLLSPPHRFSLQQRTTRAEAMADIIFALKSNQVPVATRIDIALHWVVVWGVQTDVEPVPGGNYSVELVYCNNPKLLTTPPNPHSALDICPLHAMAGVQSAAVVPYSEWFDKFLDDPNAGGQFVVVLDAKTPGGPPVLAADDAAAGPPPPPVNALQRDIGLPRAPVPPTPRPGPLTQESMVDESRMALAAMQLPGSAPRSALDLMDGAEPGAAIRIQQLDRAESHYFLVPWTLGGKLVTTIQIDGATGRFVSAQFHDGRWLSELGSADREVVLGQLSRLQQIDVDDTAAGQPTLVWRPSLESCSPHFPFVQVTGRLRPDDHGSLPAGFLPTAASGSQQLFVRLDGSIFPSLRERL